jgi:hypothetical protein
MIASADVEQLAELARLEAERRGARTRERRAASHLYFAMTIPPARSLTAARRAVESYGTAATQADALELLGRLTKTVSESNYLPGEPR